MEFACVVQEVLKGGKLIAESLWASGGSDRKVRYASHGNMLKQFSCVLSKQEEKQAIVLKKYMQCNMCECY